MPQSYSGRVTLILVILLGALFMIFPPKSLFDPSIGFSQKLNLKPGIDMVGGTSLTYEIATPAGGFSGNLAQQVMESLKRRVDPDGVRNLIWRPEGNNRLEIQMPFSAQTEQAKAAREAYSKARQRLTEGNVRPSQVFAAVEQHQGAERVGRLEKLAMGSGARAQLFSELAAAWDKIQQAASSKDVLEQAKLELKYDELKNKVAQTNMSVDEVESALALKGQSRQDHLAALEKRAADMPGRVAALKQFVGAYDQFSQVKGAIDDAGELKRLLKGSGVLEFHILATGNDLSSAEVIEMRKRLQPGGKGTAQQAGDSMRWYQVDRPEDFQQELLTPYNGKFWALAWTTQGKQMVNGPGIQKWALESAHTATTEMGIRAVGFRFDPQGAKYFAELTGGNLQRLMAVLLDDKIISAATIQSTISRDGVISREAGYTDAEFGYLISTLNAGSLPASLSSEPIQERTVEPQLGSENLRAGLWACAYGLVIVAIFLCGYYFLAGMVATFAVLMNVVLILGSMAALNATFTLPGIAGIVLTIGAAVDANVLIFERLREEQHRGMSLRMALRNAYDRAFSAIVDSNVTTVITALILYWLGSEEVKGFGLTLLIGLAWSLFTALFVTKTIFGIMVDKFHIDHLGSLPLTFPRWDKLLQPKINWLRLAWGFMAVSGLVMVIGMAAFVIKARQGQVLGIDFAGGTGVQVEFKQPIAKEQVERRLRPYEKSVLPSPVVMKMGGGGGEYEILTPNTDAAAVRRVISTEFQNELKIEAASRFDNAADPIKPVETVLGSSVVPIESDTQTIAGFTPVALGSHQGGVAIVLSHLNPPLRPSQIKTRIERQRLQPTVGQSIPARDIDVENPEGTDAESSTAVVMVSDANLPYGQDRGKWQETLAGPYWRLVNSAINKEAQLQKVSKFGAQVAGDTTQAALLALFMSLVVIMAYIWLRFGNLLYGTATVAAMLHDTFLVLGLVGLSHYLADTALGRALLVDAGFRIDLTMVAAILTVMSYSMIDTIVVFDRVRENRGKFGHMDKQVINDSINQTLSRTLLTGTTNIFTVLIMYVAGGPGIHSFTFVLLVGIVVGTYSSIAIAAPMLLLGVKAAQPKIKASGRAAGVSA